MDYVVGGVAALITGNVTPSRPKLMKRALTPTKHQPSPNVTPKSELADDRSIFLSPTLQKKKAIVKKSPKRIFENPDLDYTSNSVDTLKSPKADKVKKYLQTELEATEDTSKDTIKKSKKRSNSSLETSLDISTANEDITELITSNNNTPKKKKKHLENSQTKEVSTEIQKIQSPEKSQKNLKKIHEPNTLQSIANGDSTDKESRGKDAHSGGQESSPNKLSKSQKRRLKRKQLKKKYIDKVNEAKNRSIDSEMTGQKSDSNEENQPKSKKNKKQKKVFEEANENLNPNITKPEDGQLKDSKSKFNKKNKKGVVKELYIEDNTDTFIDKDNLEEKDEAPSKKKQKKNKKRTSDVIEEISTIDKIEIKEKKPKKEKKKKEVVNPNAVTNKDTDSEHESDDEIQSENEAINKETLESALAADNSSEEEEDIEHKEKQEKQQKKEEKVEHKIDADEVKRTLFVGNVPFSLKCKKIIKKIFNKYGKIETVRIRTVPVKDGRVTPKLAVIKNDLHPERTTVNMYIKFADVESVDKALVENNTIVDNNHLRVTRTDKSGSEHDPHLAIFVGNMPFAMEDEALRTKFEKCGEIESVRIIRDKKTNAGKGFGYVNFASKDGVELALALSEEDLTIKNRILRVKRCTQATPNQAKRQANPKWVAKSEKEGAFRRLMHKRKNQDPSGDGPPKKRPHINQPTRDKKERKEFVGMTAEKKKKRKFDKGQKKKKIVSQILTNKS